MQSINSDLQHGDVAHVSVFFDAFSQACFDNNVLQSDVLQALDSCRDFVSLVSRANENAHSISRYKGAYAMSPRVRSSSRTDRATSIEIPQILAISLMERVPSTRKRISNNARLPSGLEYASM